jgi:hypothetical protein
MFKALIAGSVAVAIARPIKETESFSAWKEEVSNFSKLRLLQDADFFNRHHFLGHLLPRERRKVDIHV